MENKQLATNIIVAVLLIATIAEIVFVALLYINSDEVECNFLWCTFTSRSEEIYTTTSVDSSCSMNGEAINCSEIAGWIDLGGLR